MGNNNSGMEERREEFNPRAELHILVSDEQNLGPISLCQMKTEMAHTCLRSFFYPYQSAATVTWTRRKTIVQSLMSNLVESNDVCQHTIYQMTDSVYRALLSADAVLFVSRDAETFMNTHGTPFIETLCVCLSSVKDKIVILDMSLKRGAW